MVKRHLVNYIYNHIFMKKDRITGGSGFIGQQITSLLLIKNIKLNLVIYLNQIRFF